MLQFKVRLKTCNKWYGTHGTANPSPKSSAGPASADLHAW
jgi:hypothetical protein